MGQIQQEVFEPRAPTAAVVVIVLVAAAVTLPIAATRPGTAILLGVCKQPDLDRSQGVAALVPSDLRLPVRHERLATLRPNPVVLPQALEDRPVHTLAAVEGIVLGAPVQDIVASATFELVSTSPAFQQIIAPAALEPVVAQAAQQRVVAGAAFQPVIPLAALDQIDSGDYEKSL